MRSPCLECKRQVKTYSRGRCRDCLQKSHGGACSAPGCRRKRVAYGKHWTLCGYHRQRKRQGLEDWYLVPPRKQGVFKQCIYCKDRVIKALSKQACSMHYSRMRKGLPMGPQLFRVRKSRTATTCSRQGCVNQIFSRGVCRRHKRNPDKPPLTAYWMRHLKPKSRDMMVEHLRETNTPVNKFIVQLLEAWVAKRNAHIQLLQAAADTQRRQAELEKYMTNHYQEKVNDAL